MEINFKSKIFFWEFLILLCASSLRAEFGCETKVKKITAFEDRMIAFIKSWNYTCTRYWPENSSLSSCDDLYAKGYRTNGFYTITVTKQRFQIYCEFDDSGIHWLVFQQRNDGSVDFYRNWENYTKGFGDDESGEMWLGLDTLHAVTTVNNYMLRVELSDFSGNTAYAEYSHFSIGNASVNYPLDIGTYMGTAQDSLQYHNHQQFSTFDQDNDLSSENCAESFHGGWWYNNCYGSNLNGQYVYGDTNDMKGVTWIGWTYNYNSMKATKMKIRTI